MKPILGILALLTLFSWSIQAQSFLTNGLVAYYPLQGNANDSSGNGNNGTIYGGVTLTTNRFGNANSAYSFNGTNGYIDIGQPVGSSPSQFSESVWVKYNQLYATTVGPQVDPIISQRQQDGSSWAELGIQIYSATNGVATLTADATDFYGPCSGVTQIQPNTWVFICGVFSNNVYQIYVNGNLENTSTAPIFLQSTDHMYLMYQASWDDFFQGSLSDVRIYDRALSSKEVAEIYQYQSIPIQIPQNPTNTSVLEGQSATLSVLASSSLPISYQWYSSAPNYSSFAGAYAQAISGFVYGAVVTNGGAGYGVAPSVSFLGGGGSGAAGFATVSNGVVTGITVTNAGANYTSAPEVVFGPANGFISGATNTTLTLSNVNAGDVGDYYVVVSSSQGGISSSLAKLDILFPPSITNQPQDAEVEAYGSALFSVSASGTTPISFQWTFNGTNIPNATSDTLSITNITPANLGAYAVIVTNDYGSVTSSNANLYMYPYLETPFSGAITYWGQTNILSVGAWGSGNLGYQWYLNGNAIDGATGSTLALPAIQFTNAGLYSVVVSSSLGSVTNTPEQVVVNPANTALQLCANVVIQGTVGYTYIIESTMNLGDTNSWVVETNLTLTQPMEFWDDTSVDVHSNAQKYYRVLPAQ